MPPPPPPLAQGRLSAACPGPQGRPAGRSSTVHRARRVLGAAAGAAARGRLLRRAGEAGAPRRAHPDAPAPSPAESPPRGRGRRASLRAREVPATRGGHLPLPDPQAALGSAGPGPLPLNQGADKEAAAASKIELWPFHVEQVTGWEGEKEKLPHRSKRIAAEGLPAGCSSRLAEPCAWRRACRRSRTQGGR